MTASKSWKNAPVESENIIQKAEERRRLTSEQEIVKAQPPARAEILYQPAPGKGFDQKCDPVL